MIDANRKWIDNNRSEDMSRDFIKKCLLHSPVKGLMDKIIPKSLHDRTFFRGIPRVKKRWILRAYGLNFRRNGDHMVENSKILTGIFKFFAITFLSGEML